MLLRSFVNEFNRVNFVQDAEFAKRKYVFFSAERPEKKRSTP